MKKKKILMYVNGDITTDARVQRAANALKNDYDIDLISTNCHKEVVDDGYHNILVSDNNLSNFKSFVKSSLAAIKIAKKGKYDLFYGHDYYSSVVIFFLQILGYRKKIIYDAHELFIPEPGFNSRRVKMFHFFEKSIVNRVDTIICANEKRGELMCKHYRLKKRPSAIRNISKLTVADDDTSREILDRLSPFMAKPGITVVYAGVVVKIVEDGILLPSPNLAALFTFVHSLSEWVGESVPLRQLVDWWLLRKRYANQIDWPFIEKTCEELGFCEFLKVWTEVSDWLFNVDSDFDFNKLSNVGRRVLEDLIWPEFGRGEGRKGLTWWTFRLRRWFGNRWKMRLAYSKESLTEQFFMHCRSHILRPERLLKE